MNRSKIGKTILGVSLILALLAPTSTGLAQDEQDKGPVYIVQAGDSLWDIALRFRVSMQELARVNSISDPSQLVAGTELVIPGLEGIQGILTTRSISYGDSLRGLSRLYQAAPETLIRLNHLTSPAELYAGSTLVILQQETEPPTTQRSMLHPGQSLLELAILHGTTPWAYIVTNNLGGTSDAVPGDVLHLSEAKIAASEAAEAPSALPEAISNVSLQPLPFVQGKAAIIQIEGQEGTSIHGSLAGREVHFFPDGMGSYTGLQGIHAMIEPGLYSLVLTGTVPAEAPHSEAMFAFSQAVLIQDGGYPFDPVLKVSPETIDPAVTKPEDAQWAALAAPVTPEKLWSGPFQSPVPELYKDCFPSMFGNRRSYNGSAYSYFHSGLDFCGGVGTDILAPAAGKVVFAGPLTVRGYATMIDHGWGVYTGYLHQSEILVKAGDIVKAGQVIGKVGGTGRVTGPHLHFEVWAGGVQVDPLDWLQRVLQ